MPPNTPDDSLDFCESLLKEIEKYVKNDPGNRKWQYELSKCHARIGSIHFSQGHTNAGTNSFLTALNILEQLSKNDPDNSKWQYDLFRTYEMLGDFLQSQGDLSYAELMLSQAVTIRKKLLGEYDPEYVTGICKLARLYTCMNKYGLAESLLRQQLVAYEKSAGIEPPGYALCLDQLGGLYQEMGNYTDSEILFLKALHIKKNIFGEAHQEYLDTLDKLKKMYLKTGRLNSLYGDMSKAMQGIKPDKTEITGNAALNKIEDMLQEFHAEEVERKTNYPVQNKISENVNFAVSFPSAMLVAESYILDVWVFLEEQRNLLLSRVKEESMDDASIKSSGPVIIERGATITSRLIIEDLSIEPSEKTLTWTGELNNSSFIARVPENITEGSKIGQAYFYINGLEISRLFFKMMISVKQKEETKLMNGFITGVKYKTAFASYASADRNEVLARVQGLEKAGIDVFMDVHNLRSGDRFEEKLLEKIRVTDIFYLFWSTAAKKSEWVRKEWEYALTNRGIDFISPIPLEPPDVVPPPPELGEALHFGDWTLAYKRSKTAN